MSGQNSDKNKNQRLSNNAPVTQHFAASGAAVASPEMPYDVEKVDKDKVKPAPKPSNK